MVSPTEEVATKLRSWSDLPIDILHSIVSRLPLADYSSIAAACKEWSRVVPLVYPVYQCPLLMHYMKKEQGVCRYYNPYFNKTFVVDSLLNFSGSRFLYSKDGWILLGRGCEFIFVHAITGTVRSFQVDFGYSGNVAFSCPPSSSDCIVFLISSSGQMDVDIKTIQGENFSICTTMYLENDFPFRMSDYSNPVFLHGQFYCLGSEGNLAVFSLSGGLWNVLKKPEKPDICFQRNYLVESKGDLMSVFIGKLESSFHVFRLNQSDMVWEKNESLGDQALFAGWPMSISAATSPGMQNKLHLSRVHREPEVIEADIKTCGKQIFFVPKSCVTYSERIQELKQEQDGGISHYDLRSKQLFDGYESAEYIHSIWCEPKLEDMPL